MNVPDLQVVIRGGLDLPHEGRDAVVHPQRDVLEGLWSEVVGELGRLARAMGVSPDRVDDVLQDVFVKAWKKAPAGMTRQELKWWLIRVTTNRCNLEHRRRRVWRVALETIGRLRSALVTMAGPRQGAVAAEERNLIQRALEELPPEQRSVLVLRYFEHYDAKQIGEILGMPHSTVRSHLLKARRGLARVLSDAGYEHDEER